MSSTSRRVDDLSFTLKRPHFFKIILDSSIREGKLEVPKKFVKKYGSSLPNKVLLGVPNGKEWKVEISKNDDTVWLHNGWREFAEYYSLDYGHLVVFEDKGCSEFRVIIFDKSGSEIKYPYNGTLDDEEPKHDGEHKRHEKNPTMDDDPVKILDDCTTKRRARERAAHESPRPIKKMRNDSKLRTSDCLEKGFGGGGGLSAGQKPKSGFVERSQPLAFKETSEVLKRASSFRFENPSFIITMQPSYVCTRYTLSIPRDFARKHIGKKNINVTLCVSDGRKWSAKYFYYPYLPTPTTVIRNGWKYFANDNSLKVGDVCAFEMIRTRRIKFKVFIFRVDENPNLQTSLGHGGGPKTVEPKRSLETNFAPDRTCNNGSGTSRLCDQLTGKETQALLTRKNGSSPSLSQCQIKEESSPSPSFQPHETKETNQSGRMLTLTGEEEDKALQEAVGFKSECPFFIITMQPSYLSPSCEMGIPERFFKRFFIGKQGHIVLQVQEGRTWTVKYIWTKYARFYGGWKAFAEDNNLRIGDVCVFELINRNEFLFKVFIYRDAKDGKDCLSAGKFTESALKEGTEEEFTQTPSRVRISNANKSVDNFNSEYPFFRVVICPSDLSDGCLSVPRTFVVKHIQQESKEMRLMVEGKSWPVNAVADAANSGKIVSGWTEFARENALQVGDVCFFELVRMEIVELKVSIFRHAS
ncbi:B3 domain-containing protein Os03g0619800-like [Tripterygium wilfordii]|uniref:B3 domain-containing protein Os03g0619800-like n=1 Tax=Tripterygium wilfordii TaxID=458696 RepID=UPI0018F7EA6D|nr:B3 domain-containing protein Os03g0619800-like [Tripterygium wilfordii]